jgi:hypothetical protein
MAPEDWQNLQNESLESIFGPRMIRPPEGSVIEVFGFQDGM